MNRPIVPYIMVRITIKIKIQIIRISNTVSTARRSRGSRFGAKFDGDGVMIKPSKEREEAIRRVRDDKEKRYIANAWPYRPSGGERGGGGDLDSDDWQVQRGRSSGGRGNGRGHGRTSERLCNNDKHGKNTKNLNLNSGATLGSTAARKSNSFGDSASIATALRHGIRTKQGLWLEKIIQSKVGQPTPLQITQV
jgi:hypothetical protein